jgi:hypothetical protein
MDPYLENPGLWPDVHHTLISGYRDFLAPQLRPKYVVRVEERTYISDDSDPTLRPQHRIPRVEVAVRAGWEEVVFSLGGGGSSLEVEEPIIATTWLEEEIHEAFLKIIDRDSLEVVTVIEILSLANKMTGSPGGQSFEQKRREIMNSPTHWVEVDLLRGKRMVPVPRKAGPHEYLVHVSKLGLRPRGLLYPIRLSQRLPLIPIPLKPGDPDARLDLQSALDAAYDRAGYDLGIDYRSEPQPPLDGELAGWADQLLRSKGMR